VPTVARRAHDRAVGTLFLSYSAADRERVAVLASGLGHAGHAVRMDRQLAGDDGWWAGVLAAIQEADAFLFAMSRNSLDSPACQRQRDYAAATGLPVLAVRLETVTQPGRGGDRQVDFVTADAADAFRVVGAVAALPERSLAAWQPPPDPPFARLDGLARDVRAGGLGPDQQLRLVDRLRDAVEQGDAPGAARELAAIFRDRADLGAETLRRLDSVFPSGTRWPRTETVAAAGLPWTPAPPVGTLTEAAVRDAAFRKPPINRRGYDESSVDDFLDLVEADLHTRRTACTAPDQRGPLTVNMTPADVRAAGFARPPVGRRGYDEKDVDDFLDEVERTFIVLDAELNRRGRQILKR
jgi:DivIVA domain-containing protein